MTAQAGMKPNGNADPRPTQENSCIGGQRILYSYRLKQIANKARPPSVEIKRNILASLTISNGSSLFIPSLSSGGAEALML